MTWNDMEWVDVQILKDEVVQHRQALSAADAVANSLRALVAEQHDEIVRLRAAGDALAEDLGDNPWAHLLIAAWEEARRER